MAMQFDFDSLDLAACPKLYDSVNTQDGPKLSGCSFRQSKARPRRHSLAAMGIAVSKRCESDDSLNSWDDGLFLSLDGSK